MSFEIADLKLVRFAHIQNEKIVAAIQARFQLSRRDLRHRDVRRGSFLAAHAAEFVVVDELVDGGMLSAHRAVGILAQFQLAEFHGQSVKQQQAASEAIAAAEDQLDGLHGLNGPDDSGQHAQNAALRARWHEPGWRRLRIQAAIARTIGHAEHGHFSFEAKNRAVHIGLTKQNARVVDEIAGGKIVGAIDDDIEIFRELERVVAGQLRFERLDLNIRIQAGKALARRSGFRLANVAGAECHLPLQIREVHYIEVYQAQSPHTGSGEVQTQRRAQAAGANQQHLGALELELTFHADFG